MTSSPYSLAPHEERYLGLVESRAFDWRRRPAAELRPGDVVVYGSGRGCTQPLTAVRYFLGEYVCSFEGGTYHVRDDLTPLVGRRRPLSARTILRAEYGKSKNFMTPDRLAVGKLGPDAAYELSAGTGLEPGSRIYGVSVVVVRRDGTTERDYDASGCFSSLDEARAHIDALRPPVLA